MLSYIVRRLLLMIPTLVGITAVAFFVMAYSPGGVVGPLLNVEGEVDSKAVRALRDYYNQRYGLDQPRIVQYLRWMNMVAPIGLTMRADGTFGEFRWIKAPNLGYSFSRNRPVTDLYKEALPITILLNLLTLPLVFLVPIIAGIYAARYRGGLFDVSSSVMFLALWSIPTMWAGVMLIGMLANREFMYWFPTGGLSATAADQMAFLPQWAGHRFEPGWLLDRIWHLFLPVVCLSYSGLAVLSRLTRGSMLENLAADFVRTARAKGVDDHSVLFTHVLRNSLLPLITVSASILPGLLAGSVIVETIFSIPGMGKLTIDAINARDRELVLAGVLAGGVLGLICQLARDICYAIADPRVSYE